MIGDDSLIEPFGIIDNFKCFDVLGFQFYCDEFIGGGGGSGGGGGAGRDWPDDSTCKNDAGQIIDCEFGGTCYEFLTDDRGPLPVTSKAEVPCKNGEGKVCYDDNFKIVDCSDIYTSSDRMCMHLNGVIGRGPYGSGPNKGVEYYVDKIAEYGLTSVPCNDVVDCMNGYDAKTSLPLYIDCNTPGPMGNYVQKAGVHNGKYVGYYPIYPIDLTADRLYTGSNSSVCVHDYDFDSDPLASDFGVRNDGFKDDVMENDPCFIYAESPSICYDTLGFKVECDDMTTFLKIPRNTDIPYIYPNAVEVPPLDCDICQFFDECMSIFEDWQYNFNRLMAEISNISFFGYTLDSISFSASNLSWYISDYFPKMLKVIEEMRDILKGFNITLPEVPTDPEVPPLDGGFISDLFQYLKDIKELLTELKVEIVEEAGTNFWDFLGGLFGDVFEFIEFLIEKVIYLVVPENGDFILDSFSALSDAMNKKFEPMAALKTTITGSLMVEQKNFEDIHMNLPIYGSVKFLDVEFLNFAIPKIRGLLSGIMIIITSIWAYRKVSSGMIK